MKKNKLVAPFVKWVGGKRQLMPAIKEILPNNFSTYYEPFIGGGAVLFEIQPKKAFINDSNEELVNTYKVIKNYPEELISDLKTHINTSDYFYKIRSLDRESNFDKMSDIKRASRVIYLNKTCYNGLYRVNNSGEFNSPFGRYKNPNIVNEVTIRAVSKYLRNNDITIINGDFENALNNIRKGSFVYFDPPYDPVSKSSNFTGYVQGGFNIFDQVRLRDLCDKLDKKGVSFLVSNSATQFIMDLYSRYNITLVKANRPINSDATKRGEIDEVLIRNYE
ncbi:MULTISPECIES: DNA adenine methylase [Aequorivita]|uniref:Site-specific DNA-methyltransferase (adenine-specific) n=1 Tax=Aequorivita iocasae TaxID=2803865 RepID=A0ABX7DRS6_9FLAO|nr:MULTISPECIES: DNA adenine methylase [Aequorivita]QQX76851.1 DNA adenine methylase [Aequorivita iocasae]UCA56323.1 DNA adenine methylase [Aequorivita sp. F7]